MLKRLLPNLPDAKQLLRTQFATMVLIDRHNDRWRTPDEVYEWLRDWDAAWKWALEAIIPHVTALAMLEERREGE